MSTALDPSKTGPWAKQKTLHAGFEEVLRSDKVLSCIKQTLHTLPWTDTRENEYYHRANKLCKT